MRTNEYFIKIFRFLLENISFSSRKRNYLISVDVKLSEENTKKSYLDSKDKLDILIKNNPDIEKLIDDLKLRI